MVRTRAVRQHNARSVRRLSESGTAKFRDLGEALLLYIQHFKNQYPRPVYRRVQDRGRLAPEGLRSWSFFLRYIESLCE